MAENDGNSGGVALVGTASLHTGAFADTPPVSRTSGSADDNAAPSFKRERFKKVDLAGERFGRLTVLYETGERKHRKIIWHCKCDCGNEVDVISACLLSRHTTSCGCFHRERLMERNTKHGMSCRGKTYSLYGVWQGMLNRCRNFNTSHYHCYGGRGIIVCNEWQEFIPFYDWAMANGYQEGLEIDRVDVNGNYEPSNCRWVTHQKNSRNRRDTARIEWQNELWALCDLADRYGINRKVLYDRIFRYHWDIERALTQPVRVVHRAA